MGTFKKKISQTTKQPEHVAIIMDGNGRWARARHLPRTAGHKRGVETTKAIVRHAGDCGLAYLTLYAFSAENWQRPAEEITELMNMLRRFLKSDAAELIQNNVRLRVIGARDRLDDDIKMMIQDLEDCSCDNTGLNLTIALDYGGRQEIVQAAKNTVLHFTDKLVSENDLCDFDSMLDQARYVDAQILHDVFEENLMTAGLPDPDLLIRTSGEMRISNFLLWQCAYSEFYFTQTLWPDFTPAEFDQAIAAFHNRDRRYGKVAAGTETGS